MSRLGEHIKAINELRDTLGEDETLSELSNNNGLVSFTIFADGEHKFNFKISSPEAYPSGPNELLCLSSATSIDISTISNKIRDHCTISKVLALLGRQLNVDLEWAMEAVEESSHSGGDSDEEMADGDASEDDMLDGGYDGDEYGDVDDEVLREWSRRLVQMEAIEAELVRLEEENGPGATNALGLDKQIFDQKAAYKRLVNELEEIFKAQDFNLMADAPGPLGLFQWEVSLAGFSPDSPLAADLHQAGRKFGVSSVQLQITFKRGLHPFFPPSVRVVSPRFVDFASASAVSCFPLLKNDRWDPMLSAKEVLMSIKEFLEAHARVDFETAQQTYHRTEDLNARLQVLTGTPPADTDYNPAVVYAEAFQAIESKQDTMYSSAPAPGLHSPLKAPAAKKPRSETPPPVSEGSKKVVPGSESPSPSPQPASGLAGMKAKMSAALGGGGRGGGPGGASSSAAATAAAAKIAWKQGVGYGTGHRAGGREEVWDARRAEAIQSARDAEAYEVLKSLASEIQSVFAAAPAEGSLDCQRTVTAVTKGCVVPLLIQQLSSAGFHDMLSRGGYYRALLEVVDALCHPDLSSLLARHGSNDTKSIATAMVSLKTQASTFLKVLQSDPGTAAGSSKSAGDSEDDTSDSELATFLLQTASKVLAMAPAAGDGAAAAHQQGTLDEGAGGSNSDPEAAANGTAAAEGTGSDAHDVLYISTLSPYRVSVLSGIADAHSAKTSAATEPTAPSRQRARRVASELAALEQDLPVNPSSSVFVVADEQQTVLWKAIITGPKGTPYEGGVFLFDIYFPSDYPTRPPIVKFRTTGGGSVRFNPNLYNEGKVCLSLLGTWSGSKGESWNPDYSSILQVLVSIQSLILCELPFYNEPGYEARPDDQRSNEYNAHIMEQCVRWAMLDQLRSPPDYFAEVIRSHFKIQGDVVLATVRRWVQWCDEKGFRGRARNIEKMLPELEAEIKKLQV